MVTATGMGAGRGREEEPEPARVRVDSVIAIPIGLFILPRAHRLGRDALRILVEPAPAHIDVEEISRDLERLDAVVEAHGLHV